jgi:hypothetical protein
MTNRMESRLFDIFAGIAVLLATIGSTRISFRAAFADIVGDRHRFSYSWSHPAQRTGGIGLLPRKASPCLQ